MEILAALVIVALIFAGIRSAYQKSVEKRIRPIEDNYAEKLSVLHDQIRSFRNQIDSLRSSVAASEQKARAAYSHAYQDIFRSFCSKPALQNMELYQILMRQSADPNFDKRIQGLASGKEVSASEIIEYSAKMQSASGHVYHTSLTGCDCPDFTFRHRPCKHMFALAIQLGALSVYDNSPVVKQINHAHTELRRTQSALVHLYKERKKLEQECDATLKRLEQERDAAIKTKEEIDKLVQEQQQTYPWVAARYADIHFRADKSIADALRWKAHPALKAADAVQKLASEKRDILSLCKQYEYQLTFYESLFPWLEEFKQLPPADAWDEVRRMSTSENQDEYAAVREWLSPEEYQNLPTCEKYQLALDRYTRRPKSNWQIGIEYERYVGYLYESKGYSVRYNGATEGLQDMGRDLIAENKTEILVIQCKRWASEKTIHEKHIFQLYGSCVLFSLANPNKTIKGVFITTTKLSETARECAEYLQIEIVEEHAFQEYPRIKCNISKDGKKIYHLPFDQQYDRVQICISDGEGFASTVAEAESLGFRRAYRWTGTK